MSNPYMDDDALERRRRSDEASKELGDKLLQGWKMLNETCDVPNCYTPMLESRTGEKLCVACNPSNNRAPSRRPPAAARTSVRSSATSTSTSTSLAATRPASGGAPSSYTNGVRVTPSSERVDSATLRGNAVAVLDAPADWMNMSQEELLAYAQRQRAGVSGVGAGAGAGAGVAAVGPGVRLAPEEKDVPPAPTAAPSTTRATSTTTLPTPADAAPTARRTAAVPAGTAALPPAPVLPEGGAEVVASAQASLLKALDQARMQLDLAGPHDFTARAGAAKVMAECATALQALGGL